MSTNASVSPLLVSLAVCGVFITIERSELSEIVLGQKSALSHKRQAQLSPKYVRFAAAALWKSLDADMIGMRRQVALKISSGHLLVLVVDPLPSLLFLRAILAHPIKPRRST